MSKLITENDLKNILNEVLPIDNDSGWIQATLTSEFTQYGTDNVAKYRRIGNIVQVTGIIKPTASLAANDAWHTIFTLPEGYAPPNVIINLMQGSGNAMWACAVNTEGEVRLARYRDLSVTTGGGYVSPGTSTWLPFSITFMVAGGDVSVGHSSAVDYVVEEGVNGDSTYRKWNSGIAECWIKTTQNVALNNTYGSLYQGTWNWSFPITFLDAPTVTCSYFMWGTGASWGTIAGVSETNVSLRGIDVASRASGSTIIHAYAIGKWK